MSECCYSCWACRFVEVPEISVSFVFAWISLFCCTRLMCCRSFRIGCYGCMDPGSFEALQQNPTWPGWNESEIDEKIASLNTGDVILVRSGSGWSVMERAMIKSPWDHVGIVVRQPAGGYSPLTPLITLVTQLRTLGGL
jgi:hypothetical protein